MSPSTWSDVSHLSQSPTQSPVAPLFPTQNTFGDSYGALKACVELPCLTEFEQETLPACVDPLDFFFGDAADLLQSSPADTTTLSDQPDENWLAVDHETLNTYLETLLDIDLCCSTTSTDFPSPTAKNTDTLERQPILNTHVPPSSIQYRLSPLSPLSPPFDYPSPSGPIDVHQIYANILSTKPVADGTFFCPIPTCGRSFVRRYNLKTHFAAAHCSIREYNCTMCERRPFSRKFDLHRHMELKHNQASVSPRHQHRKRSNVVVAPPPSPASTADANDDFDDCPLSSKSGKRKNCEAAAVSNPPPKKSRSQASCTRCRSSK
ncbi:hypothetical protein DFJ77DRAFT_464440 [Powellomyces hirtus]|nr:hypothetical protein DFJ77DRAFT_464440 [Powellomyces hirtus]